MTILSEGAQYWGVDAMRMLALIASRGGVTTDLMAAELGLSRSTAKRYLLAARQAFGVVVSFAHNPTGGGGEYVIEDWGVLDGRKVLAVHHPNKWQPKDTPPQFPPASPAPKGSAG